MTHARGERADCFRQYLAPVLGRPNLTVLTDAKTLRVETEGSGAATVTQGVTFQVNGPDGSKHAGAPPLPPAQGTPLMFSAPTFHRTRRHAMLAGWFFWVRHGACDMLRGSMLPWHDSAVSKPVNTEHTHCR